MSLDRPTTQPEIVCHNDSFVVRLRSLLQTWLQAPVWLRPFSCLLRLWICPSQSILLLYICLLSATMVLGAGLEFLDLILMTKKMLP